jgi:hypothetical protein
VLYANEVLNPQSSERAVGFFKGERIFLQRDVSLALPAKPWHFRGLQIKDLNRVKREFKALESYMVLIVCVGTIRLATVRCVLNSWLSDVSHQVDLRDVNSRDEDKLP